MPEIKSYESQVAPSGAPQVQRVTGEDFGAGVGRAMNQFGSSLGQLGEVLQKRKEQQEVSDLNATTAKIYADHTVKYQKQLQDGTLNTEEFMKSLGDDLDKVQQNVETRGGRQYFNQISAQLNKEFLVNTAHGQAVLAGDQAKQNFLTGLEARSSALENDPGGFEMSLGQHRQAVDAQVQTGGLPAKEADELKRKGDTELAKSAVYGWSRLNPDIALKKLDAGDFDKYMNGDVKRRMYQEVRQAQSARLVDDERLKKKQQDLVQKQQEGTQNQFLAKMQDGSLSTKDILDSNLDPFGSGSKEAFIAMLSKKNKESAENKMTNNPFVQKELFDRVHADPTDPKRITDANDLNKYYGDGLNDSGLSFLRKEIEDRGTPQGEENSRLKKAFFEMGYQKLAKPDPMTKLPDEKALGNYQSWLAETTERLRNGQAKGKRLADMMNPKSPDFVGDTIEQYQRTPMEVINDMAKKFGDTEDKIDMIAPDGTQMKIPKAKVEEAKKRGAKIK